MEDKFDLKRETDHWMSYLLASIAEECFRNGVSKMIQHYHDGERPKPVAREDRPEEPIVVAGERLTLSVTEAAQILGVSRGRAYKFAREGVLPVIRLGHKVIVPRKALTELLSAGWKAE